VREHQLHDLFEQDNTPTGNRSRTRTRRPGRGAEGEADQRALDDAFARFAEQHWPGVAEADGYAEHDEYDAGDGADDEYFDYDEDADAEGEFAPDPNGGPPAGDRWSTWDQPTAGERGPQPYPAWLVTDLAAVDTDLGIMKTGKEADVFLMERSVPGDPTRHMLVAAKRYRSTQHRMFHRDAGYTDGRRDKESRVNRAVAKGTAFGKQAQAGQWAAAEFGALVRLYNAGAAVPYPIQILGTEILMEFIGDEDGAAAPRLAQLRPEQDVLLDLWEQLEAVLSLLARDGFAHGDLSAYNILVHEGRLVVIDVPQIVDVVGNPQGREYLERDVRNVGAWFVSRGLPTEKVEQLAADLAYDAGLG
jgi:RIO kinase 1